MQSSNSDQLGNQSTLRRLLDGSRTAGLVRRLRRSIWESRVRRLGTQTANIARSSFLYRWLTKEPEPEVIVIDLRETYTVGPLIRALDWTIGRVQPCWRESRVKSGLDRAITVGERLAETRPGRLLVRLLEPPEPPAERDSSTDRETKDDTNTEEQSQK